MLAEDNETLRDGAEQLQKELGYRFRDERLLDMALTTPACRMTSPGVEDNQRLEFLGDSILNMLAADELYREFPSAQEGELSERRVRMVSTPPLCAAAVRLGMKGILKRNKGASELRDDAKVLADAMEAIIGAAWMDGGIEAAQRVYAGYGLEAQADAGYWSVNPKGDLQKRAQALLPHRHPAYEIVSVVGTSHEPLFRVKVTVDTVGEAFGEARTRKDAETAAARKLLECGRWPDAAQ